jgi:steroid delta-isomerase-like uncharacterized protein
VNARHRLTILAVADLGRARRFYREAFDWDQTVDDPVYVELALPDGMRLGLHDRAAFAANTGGAPAPAPEATVTPAELYLYVDDVEAASHRLLAAGARLLSPPARRDWGDECAYFADLDGHVIALASGEPAVDPAERLRAVALRWLKLWQRGDLADFDAIHAPEFVDFAPAGRPPTRDGFREGLIALYQTFPDFDVGVEDLVVDTAARKVVVRWSATATHGGSFLGVAPTGRTVVFHGIEIVRIERDLIVERWGEWDGLEVLEQLGVAPHPTRD